MGKHGGRTALYRHYADDVLLYVGITKDPAARWSSHSKKVWRAWVDHTDLVWYPNRHTAEAAERQAIAHELPLFNIEHNGRRGDMWARITQQDAPAFGLRRFLEFARVVALEPRLLDLASKLCWHGSTVCGDCMWDELRLELHKLVGYDAIDPPCEEVRTAWAYEVTISAFYELLPWVLCEEHYADTFDRGLSA